MTWLLLIAAPLLLGLWAQRRVDSTVARYGEVQNGAGLAGYEVASRLLAANGLQSAVRIMSAVGASSDHYDPRERTIHLSEPVFQRRTVSAAAIAAHEVGHALQHAAASRWFRLRAAIWPVAGFAANMWFVGLLLGMLLGSVGLVWAAVALFAGVVLFQLVTLPVELDASRRAHRLLDELGIVAAAEAGGVRRVLRAAASTYVVAALASALLLLYAVGGLRRG
jgi:Zn-dependent membrane protease YugP